MEDNYNIVNSNNFFEEVNTQDPITIKVSNYKTHTHFFRFISYISFNDKEYLSLEDGIKNIKTYVEFYENPLFK